MQRVAQPACALEPVLRLRHNFSFVIPAKTGIQWALVIAER
jgi:hypothetical protein